MKKQFATILVAVAVLGGATVHVATPTAPDKYVIHTVTYGETVEGIIKDANKNIDVNYDIREAAATAVAESKKIEGGATGYLIRPGDKIAVPIYR